MKSNNFERGAYVERNKLLSGNFVVAQISKNKIQIQAVYENLVPLLNSLK